MRVTLLFLTYLAQVRRFLEGLCFRAICLCLRLHLTVTTMRLCLVTKSRAKDMVFRKAVAITGIVPGVVK